MKKRHYSNEFKLEAIRLSYKRENIEESLIQRHEIAEKSRESTKHKKNEITLIKKISTFLKKYFLIEVNKTHPQLSELNKDRYLLTGLDIGFRCSWDFDFNFKKIYWVVGFSGGFLHQYAPKCIYLQSFARKSYFVILV